MKRLSGKWLALLFLLPFAAFFVIFQIAPLAWVALNSLKASDAWSLANYLELFGSPFYRQAIRHSLEIAGWSSLLGLLIAVLGSHSLRHVDSRLRDFVMAFSNMTSNFAGVPLAFAFIILLGFNGALTLLLKQAGWIDDFNLYSKTGLIILYTYFQIPLGVMLLYPAFDALREDWRESAALLGANGWQYWRHIGIPVLTPALLGTFVILLANALGALRHGVLADHRQLQRDPDPHRRAGRRRRVPRPEHGQRPGHGAGRPDDPDHPGPPMAAAQELPCRALIDVLPRSTIAWWSARCS